MGTRKLAAKFKVEFPTYIRKMEAKIVAHG